MLSKLAHFQILQEIGRGGMGIVYKARDVRLQRYVAIKILPHDLVAKKKNLQRFTQEARTASALNHPNICTIYDVGQSDGIRYIVMEFVAGKTLREILNRKGFLPEKEIIQIGLKICDALQAAHIRGIIHRDIKPENIMISSDGIVKVMDFGLAKLIYDQNAAQKTDTSPLPLFEESSANSSSSTFRGTVFYMAPEQVENRTIDGRTDIFALGAVLFEMACGNRPFHGKTIAEVMNQILSAKPSYPAPESNQISNDLFDLILKALKKDPVERFQQAKDLAQSIKRLKLNHDRSSFPINWGKRIIVATLVLLILISSLVWFASNFIINNSNKIAPGPFSNSLTTPLTNWAGLEEWPAFSPDGKRIAFHSDRSGNNDIWYRELSTTQYINLTEHSSFNENSPCWSPDGNKISFVSDRDGGGIFVIDVNTKEEQRITNYGKQPSWSPDGNRIAFIAESEKEICTLSLSEGKIVSFFKVNNDDFLHTPAWSVDGKWISFTRGTGFSWNVWIKSTENDQIHAVTQDKYKNHSPEWHPQNIGIFFYSDRSGIQDIWYQKIDPVKMIAAVGPVPVTKGAGVTSYDISFDRKKIAYATVHNQGNIHALALADPDANQNGKIRKITNWNRFTLDPAISPDGNKILMTSNIHGNFDIWLCDRDGKNAEIVHRARNVNETAVWSPDGNSILFVNGEAADRELTRMNLINGQEKYLTNNDVAEAYPDLSPDGKWIVFSRMSDDNNIWIMPFKGGEPRQLTSHISNEIAPRFSPDGKVVSFVSNRDGHFNIWTVPFSGGAPTQVTFNKDQGRINLGHCWSVDGSYIFYCRTIHGIRNIWKISLDGGEQEQLTFFASCTHHVSRGSRMSTDGIELFFTTYERTGDIWLMEDQTFN